MTALFEVRGLQKAFGGLTVIDDVSFALAKGDRVAVIGPNGAGKTTLVNVVTGLTKPDAGSVWLDGVDVTTRSPARRVRAGLVRSFQVTRLFSEMTPREHVGLALLQRKGRAGAMFSNFRTMPDIVAETADSLGVLGLAALADIPVSDIAYGQQRLLEIALAMALRPKVLLLDEPAAGVSGADTVLIEKALAQLPAELAIVMIEHDMDFVFRFARRVIVLAAGAIIFDGTPAEVAEDARVRSAYLGSYADARGIA